LTLGRYHAKTIGRIKPVIQKGTTQAHTTLKMLLKMPKRVYLFSRRNRYAVGSVLASSLMELQNSSWLAHSLDHENVIFHMQDQSSKTELLTKGPFVKNAFYSSKIAADPSTRPSNAQQDRFATRSAIFR
jgi:hypothetical protein